MKISKAYKLSEFLAWTRRKLYVVLALAIVPVAAYQLLDEKWIALPWSLAVLLGTAPQTRAILITACLLSQAATARAVTGGPESATILGGNPAQRVTELADAYVKAWFEAFPENATYFAPPGARHDRLTDNSLAAGQAWEKIEDDLAARLTEVREESLWGTPEWVTYGFLREALESSRGLRVCRNELWPVSQMNGWQVSVTWLLSLQPVGTADLRAQALARWRGCPATWTRRSPT